MSDKNSNCEITSCKRYIIIFFTLDCFVILIRNFLNTIIYNKEKYYREHNPLYRTLYFLKNNPFS